jgi:hypothetical protein
LTQDFPACHTVTMDQIAKVPEQILPKNHDAEKHFIQRHTWMYWVPAIVGLVIGLLIGGTVIGNIGKTTNDVIVEKPLASPTKKPAEKTIWKTYNSIVHGFSFEYPSDWELKESDTTTTFNTIRIINLLTIQPKTSLNNDYYPNEPIQLYVYLNPENLSIEAYNQKYLNQSVAGDPVSIWAPTYSQVTNEKGVSAYYDAEHYCVAICKIYVWQNPGKIFVLKSFPVEENQDSIYQKVFATLTTKIQKPTSVTSIFPTQPLNPNPSEVVYCTADAKQCPDGSWVGRAGPKCEFTPCPPAQ